MSQAIRVVEVTTSYGTSWYIEHYIGDQWVRGYRSYSSKKDAMQAFRFHTEGEKVTVVAEGETK